MKKLPKIRTSQIVYDGYFRLREDLLEQENGAVQPLSMLLCSDATAILAQDSLGRWILNREYRHPTGEILLSCPGGRLETGEDPIAGGKRELFEETGYWSDEVFILGCCYPFPGICNQRIFYLFAKNARKAGTQRLDPFEFIDTELLEDKEVRRRILNGENVDGILLTALWYTDHVMNPVLKNRE